MVTKSGRLMPVGAIAGFLCFISVLFVPWVQPASNAKEKAVRIGYFQGGRVNMIYRAHINGSFSREGVIVKLYTKDLKGEKLYEVPQSNDEMKRLSKGKLNFGKISGTEIVDRMLAGDLDGGTIGESSFVYAVNKHMPIVAVAMLGYDSVPGKAIIMRKGVKINKPGDLKGKTLISRRAGPGDAVFLREFIESIGLDPKKDLKIIDQVSEDDADNWIRDGKIDGGLYHLVQTKKIVESGDAYVYRPMDWMDSRLSHAVLVFRKDYLDGHRPEVQKIVNAYVKRVAYEKKLPKSERDKSWDKGLMMEGEFEDMSIPAYDMPPRLRPELLQKMQDLLLKYGEINRKADLTKHLDYSFVENAAAEVKGWDEGQR